jgi:hypothetical protein
MKNGNFTEQEGKKMGAIKPPKYYSRFGFLK